MRTHTVIDSVVGTLTLVAQEGAIVGLYMDLQRHRPDDDELGEPDPRGRAAEPFKAAADQLDAYFAGELTTFDLPPGTTWIRVPATGLGRLAGDSLRPRPSPMVSWPNASDRPAALARWAWRTGRTRSASSSRATASSAPMAASPATAAASTARSSCSTSSWR